VFSVGQSALRSLESNVVDLGGDLVLLDRLGRRIEAGCILASAFSHSLRIVTSIELAPSPPEATWLVSFLVFELGETYWVLGAVTSLRYNSKSRGLCSFEIVGNLYASVCEYGEHDYDDVLNLHPDSVSVCLRCGHMRNNTPPLS